MCVKMAKICMLSNLAFNSPAFGRIPNLDSRNRTLHAPENSLGSKIDTTTHSTGIHSYHSTAAIFLDALRYPSLCLGSLVSPITKGTPGQGQTYEPLYLLL